MDPQEWYRQMPIVTKVLFTGSLVVTLAGNFGLVNPMDLVLFFPAIWYKFQIWRLVTAVFFFGKLGFPFLVNLYFLYNYSLRIEKGLYDRQTADYVFMLLFNWVVLLAVAYFLNLVIIGLPLVISILYVWCNVNADVVVSFWFGTQFKAMYLPWVLAAFNVLLGGSGMMELVGIFVGHAYFFLKYKYPEQGGTELLHTPQFLKNLFPEEQPGISGFGQAPSSRAPPPAQPRAFQGQGHRLGDD